MKSIFLPKWLSLLFSLLTGLGPISFLPEKSVSPVPPASSMIQKAVPAPKASQIISINPIVTTFHPAASAQKYTCVFEGEVSKEGVPYEHARVTIRVISSRQHIIQEALTDAQGHYQLAVPLYGQVNENLNWEMTAQAPDFRPLETSGGQILRNDSVLKIEKQLDFLAS